MRELIAIFLICLMFVVFGAWFALSTKNVSNALLYKKVIDIELYACEEKLPRNQKCEISITARVKGKTK